MISGNLIGSYSPLGKTFIIVDDNGNEITGVCVDNPVIFTASDNDVREGMVYASDSGVSTGNKDIPAYRTTQGVSLVLSGEEFTIPLSQYNMYDYTELQCIIAPFNKTPEESVACDKVVLNHSVYPTNSVEAISTISIDDDNKSIKLNITNSTETFYVVHFFTYREEI